LIFDNNTDNEPIGGSARKRQRGIMSATCIGSFLFLGIMLDLQQIPSPCFVLEEEKLERNLHLLSSVQQRAGVSIILAYKGFALWHSFPLVMKYLSGASASSLNEVLLCAEKMNCKAHTYSPVYIPVQIEQILENSACISFNSLSELERYGKMASEKSVSVGLRVNPECSVVETDLYNPCSPFSRLGIPAEELAELPNGVDGLHVHALCESGADELELLLASVEKLYGHLLPKIKWVNLGGGHLITRKDYDVEKSVRLLSCFREKHAVDLILEPGSAIAWQTGVLVAQVLDVFSRKGKQIAMLDVSFAAHMPDTLEMPYRPEIQGAGQSGEYKHEYRLGGVTCLAGDFYDGYSFGNPLSVGQKLVFEDMMHYTMVKTNMFNGVMHPHIAIVDGQGHFEVIRSFGFDDYATRLS